MNRQSFLQQASCIEVSPDLGEFAIIHAVHCPSIGEMTLHKFLDRIRSKLDGQLWARDRDGKILSSAHWGEETRGKIV